MAWYFRYRQALFGFCCLFLMVCGSGFCADLVNLAPKAKISSDSEYSGDYLAKNVADGVVPVRGSSSDPGKAWCVNGNTHREGAVLNFEWGKKVTVGSVVYYARNAFFDNECWKDYEIYFDDGTDPIISGKLEMVGGPQVISFLKPVEVEKLTIKFVSSYGGLNPGASEIEIFSVPLKDKKLIGYLRSIKSKNTPWGIEVDCDKLRDLIKDQPEEYRGDYLKRLESSPEDELSRLQRDVLLTGVDRLVVIKRHEIVASHVYTYHYEGFKAGGGLYVVSVGDDGAEPVELVATPKGQILDCDLSYDGKVVLFSWRQNESQGYHLWTIDVDGGNLRQVSKGPWHDYNGCWLPDGGIAFLSSRIAQFAYCWHAPVGIVHRMEADGSNVQLLSANYLNDFTPYPLDDGRIIYSRWEYVDKPAIPIQSLWTVNPDGTSLSGYFGNGVLSPGTFMEARSIPGSSKIICTMTGHNGPTRGAIGIIDRSKGMNVQAAIWNITPDVPVPDVDKGNGNTGGSKLYSCPLPLDDRRFLVSAKGPVLVRTYDGGCQSVALEAPGNGMQYFNAQPVRVRVRPPVVNSGLGLADDRGTDAAVYLQDVYNGLEPHVKRGEIKRIRVVREMEKTVRIDPSLRAFGFQFPVISCGATYAGKTVLGEVPVEEDGSAYFRVPARMPIYFQAIDEHGRALQRMRSFTHLMPGEVQGCGGCHEPRRHAPSLMKAKSNNAEPLELEEPEWGVRGFDYSRIVQPVLDKYCIRCHNPVDAPKKIDLSGGKTDYFNVSYDVLAREGQGRKGSRYVSWIPTYNGHEQNILEVTPKAWGSPQSRLAEVVLSGHPDGEGNKRFEMDEISRRRILAWIDLNVPYYGSSETAYPELVGCRRVYPAKLDEVLADVGKRRCGECHGGGKVPRRVWTRVTEPEYNDFLLAPLARSAGGSGKCGKAIFKSKDDPDYKAILVTFGPTNDMLNKVPRMDMPGGVAAAEVCRDRY